jgi:hypothetical protein
VKPDLCCVLTRDETRVCLSGHGSAVNVGCSRFTISAGWSRSLRFVLVCVKVEVGGRRLEVDLRDGLVVWRQIYVSCQRAMEFVSVSVEVDPRVVCRAAAFPLVPAAADLRFVFVGVKGGAGAGRLRCQLFDLRDVSGA